MGSSKKRKRDIVETPRITYDTPTRTFDRLFKEESLDELKQTVRKKLGLPSSTAIHLSQLRDGTAVDLEDDDDFEAFQSAAYYASVALVKVTVADADQPVHVSGVEQDASQAGVVEPISASKRKLKRKKKKLSPGSSRVATPTGSPVAEDAPDVPDDRPTKKRRVSFAAPSKESLSHMPEPKNSKKSKKTDKSTESMDSFATSPAVEASDVSSDKKEKKKKKKEGPFSPEQQSDALPVRPASGLATTPEADASEELPEDLQPAVEKTSDDKKKKKKGKEKDMDATNASALDETADAEVGRKSSKSKKRARSGSQERPTEIPTTSEAGQSISASAETSTRLAKKSKKTAEVLETTQAGDKRSRQNDTNPEPTPAPSGTAAAEPSTELPAVSSKAKKEKKKAASKDTELPIDASAPAASSSPEKDGPVEEPAVVDKKLKKKKSRSNFDSERTFEVPPPVEPALPKGKKGDTDLAKAPETAQPATSVTQSSKELTCATAPASAGTSARTTSMEETTNAMAATILARLNSKLLSTEKEATTASKTATPVPPKARPAIEASSSDEPTTSTTPPETTTSASPKASAAIEPSSSKGSTTITNTNSSNASKPTAPTLIQNKMATEASTVKPPKLTAAQKKKLPCPVCAETPFHARTKCPIIKSGIRAMRKRIVELEKTNADEHAEVIEELRALIDKKSKKGKASAAKGAQAEDRADAHAEVDNSASNSPENPAPIAPSTKAAAATPKAPAKVVPPAQHDPSEPTSSGEEELPPSEPSRSPSPPPSTKPRPTALKSSAAQSKGPIASSSKTQQLKQKSVPKNSRGYDKDSSQLLDTSDVSLATIGLSGGLLGFGAGNVSVFTEGDIEALIRGPRPSLSSKNLPSSSSSSESEDELEPDVAVEEDEETDEKAQRAARRTSKIAARSDSSDEEVIAVGLEQEDDDDNDGDSSLAGDVTQQRDIIAASKVHATATPSIRASQDIPNDSSPSRSTSSPFDLRAGEPSFQEVNNRATSQVLDTSVNDVVNDIISADIGPVSPEPEVGKGEVEDNSQESKAEAIQADRSASEETAVPSDAPEAVASEESERAAADSSSSESSENGADANEVDPIEVEAPQPSQGDPIHSDADDDDEDRPQAQSTPKAQTQVAARRTRSQRNKVDSAYPPPPTPIAPTSSAPNASTVASQPSQSGLGSEPPKVTRKATRPLTKISELPVPPHPNSSIRIIKPAQIALVARTTRSKSAVAPEPEAEHEPQPEPQTQTQPEPSTALTKGRGAGVVPKTPAKALAAKTPAKVTRSTSKQGLIIQTPATAATVKPAAKTPAKPPSKAAPQTPAAKPPSKAAAKNAAFTRTTAKSRALRLTADLEEEEEEEEGEAEEQNTTINGHAPAQGSSEAGDKSLASWDVLPDRSSIGADLAGVPSSPTQNMEDELVSSPRAVTPKGRQPSQQAEADAQGGDEEGTAEAWQLRQDPLFLYDESQQSFPYSQYPGLVPKPGQEDSDDEDEDEVESTILKGELAEITKPRPSGPFRSLTEISSQSQREYFAPRFSSQLASIGKPAVKDMYGGLTGDDDDDDGSDGSDSESDSEAGRKANNSHIPETRRAGLSSKRK